MVKKRKMRKSAPDTAVENVQRGTNLRAQRIEKAKPPPVEKAHPATIKKPQHYTVSNASIGFRVGLSPEQEMTLADSSMSTFDPAQFREELREAWRLRHNALTLEDVGLGPTERIRTQDLRSSTNSAIQGYASELANSARRATVLSELTQRIGYLARRVQSITLSYEADTIDMAMAGHRVARPSRGNSYALEIRAVGEGSDRTAIPNVATSVVAQSLLTYVGAMAEAIAGLDSQVRVDEVDLLIFGESYLFVSVSRPGAETKLLVVFDACGAQVRSSSFPARERLTKRRMMAAIMTLGGMM